MSIKFNIKSKLQYTCVITPKHAMSVEPHLYGLALGAWAIRMATKKCHRSGEPLATLCPIGNLTDPGFEPQTYHINVLTTELTNRSERILVVFSFHDLGLSPAHLPGLHDFLVSPWLGFFVPNSIRYQKLEYF